MTAWEVTLENGDGNDPWRYVPLSTVVREAIKLV